MSVSTETVKVVVVDDQTLFRSGLALLLGEDSRIQVVGQAGNGLAAIDLISSLKPDVILMDVKMPELDGIEATRRIVAANPDVKVLILTTFDTESSILHALQAGASGYVLKDSRADAIVSSILAVMAGERVMASSVAARVLDMLTGTSTRNEFYDGLTPREIEVLQLLASGMANKQIAYKLRISEKTVRNHVSNMYEKLHIFDRAQAVLYAVRKGLIDL
ncbi:MAG: response regulator [Candidatus Dormibacter sp.]|uniref:response regulator n=1 Tax=Candidatus Dormibacter sp. TaxID=2973982 RepID=UPI000DB77FE9|nr:MAG: DNA-binding response regulator [Candidatus Dormibacteraeota bacterium]